jgi:hypothetical protein
MTSKLNNAAKNGIFGNSKDEMSWSHPRPTKRPNPADAVPTNPFDRLAKSLRLGKKERERDSVVAG